jgi:hypothetical protein
VTTWRYPVFPELRATLDGLRVELLDRLETPDGRCGIFGSTVMVLAGLRKRCGDVDLAVSPDLYAALATRPGWREQRPHPDHPPFLRWYGGQAILAVDAFSAWRADEPAIDLAEVIRVARLDLTIGIPVAPLWVVRKHKVAALGYFEEQYRDKGSHHHRRAEKHRLDIEIIDLALRFADVETFPVETASQRKEREE